MKIKKEGKQMVFFLEENSIREMCLIQTVNKRRIDIYQG